MAAVEGEGNDSIFRLFARVEWTRPELPAPLAGTKCDYLEWRAMGSEKIPERLRYWIKRWRLLCTSYGKPAMPRVFAIWVGDVLVHYSFVVPRLGRLRMMASQDLEIGPCWTTPGYRRQGFFRYAVERILHDYWDEQRVFWMITRNDNSASAGGILKCGFTEVGQCRRKSLRILPLHVYVFTTGEYVAYTRMTESRARDALVSRARYNARALLMSAHERQDGSFLRHGADAIWITLRDPYLDYHERIRQRVQRGWKVLDLFCGDGLHSTTAGLAGAEVMLLDLDEDGLRLAQRRAELLGIRVQPCCAAMENLPFPDDSMDMVTCAGGISYVDREVFLREVRRVLKPGGSFIFVDSFNLNPIYTLNRYMHFLSGARAFSTLRRVPDPALIRRLDETLGRTEVHYYGIAVFLIPLLVPLIGEERTAKWLRNIDQLLPALLPFAFRVVISGTKGSTSEAEAR